MIPLVLFLLISSLVYARVRAILMISLCYGVGFLALRDVLVSSRQHLPPALDYDFVEYLRPALYLVITSLVTASAYFESVRPGQIWARRCYFGGAAGYFLTTGIVSMAGHRSWQGVLLIVSGCLALFGSITADRFQDEDEEIEESPRYVDDQALLDAKHRNRIAAIVWNKSQ